MNPSPDLAVFLPSLAGGGAEGVAIHIAREFSNRGFSVDLVVGSAEGPRMGDVDPNLRVVDLGCKRFRWVLPSLIRYLRREKPSVMLSFLSQANLVAITARLVSGRPGRLVVSERLHLSAALKTPEVAWFRFLPLFMKWLYPRADGLIAVSHGVAEDLSQRLRLNRDNIAVIHNPVFVSHLRRLANEEVKHPWVAESDALIVMGVGRLLPHKDFGTLIEAVSLMDRNCRLVILGDGPERDFLESLAERLEVDLLLPGYVQNPYPWMARANVVAVSSRVEGFPNVLVEALALGTPVVSTDCPSGPSEILDRDRIGRLVPIGNAEAMSIALAETLARPPDRCLLIEHSAQWDPEAIMDRYAEVLFGTGNEYA